MINKQQTENFKAALKKLIGKECWEIVDGLGSIITFGFGEKIPRKKPVENNYLSKASQNFEAEFSLFINSVWRVSSSEKVLFGAWTETEIVHREKNQIIGQFVKKIELFEPTFDLEVTFSNDLQLSIFCDQTNEEDLTDNYDYFSPELIYTVGHKSVLSTSKYD